MASLSPEYRPLAIEAEARSLWAERNFPPPSGVIGPGTGARVWQYEGTFAPGDRAELVAQRAVAADVDARYLALAGRRAVGTLRRETFRGSDPSVELGPLLSALGIWTGGADGRPWDGAERAEGLQRMASRLARSGILVVRDRSMRICPHCAMPRTPERMVYQEEFGATYLVRFAIRRGDREVHALAWVDAPWRLLGTSALLLNPELTYVVARYRRRDAEEWILTSRSSVERLRGWLPGTVIEIVEEVPGRELAGVPYGYPLRHEFPIGGTLTAPAGTLQPSREVGDTGTGIVPLVPGHGGTDAQIAETLGVPGWPLVTSKGQMDLTLMHKYSGLDLKTADEFVIRDLAEGGATFAELRVRRGVPHCAICGGAMVWTPGRCWCLEPSRLPRELQALFARLLPGEPTSGGPDATWPASESAPGTGPGSVQLRECSRCERLDAPDGPVECSCGGRTHVVARRILPSLAGSLNAWSRQNPIPAPDTVRIYLGDRRRAPALIHHLTAVAALERPPSEVGVAVLPTIRADDLPGLVTSYGADAVRAALVRSESSTRASAPFGERVAQEYRRLARWWRFATEVTGACDEASLALYARPLSLALRDLEPVDLALVARWERVRLQALADYDRWSAAAAHRRLARFLDTDLADYAGLVRARLRQPGSSATKQAALRTLVHVLRGSTSLIGPVCPHTAEAIHRALAGGGSSLFDEPPVGVDRALLDDARARAWDRWLSVVRALTEFRRALKLPTPTALPQAAIVVAADEVGDEYRSALATLEGLSRVGHLEVGSPKQPWAGRRRELRPIESEIQRAYPAIASQMIAVLRRLPPRSAAAGAPAGEFTVVVGSHTYRLAPSMIGLTDTLPERFVPVPWSGGEIYAQLPPGLEAAAPPPLSPDAFWLVRRIQQRVRRLPPRIEGAPAPVVVVSVGEPLLAELQSARDRLARYLGVSELRVSAEVAEAAPPGRSWGRTRTGVRWWFHVPGAPVGPRPVKAHQSRGHARRVPESLDDGAIGELDFGSEAVIAEWESIRDLGRELDGLLGLPLLGPSKVAAAWSAGLRSVDAFGQAPFEQLVELPGFGISIAERIRGRLGGVVPPRPRKERRPLPRAPPAPEAPSRSTAPEPAPAARSPAPDRVPTLVRAATSTPPAPARVTPPAPVPPAEAPPATVPEPSPAPIPSDAPSTELVATELSLPPEVGAAELPVPEPEAPASEEGSLARASDGLAAEAPPVSAESPDIDAEPAEPAPEGLPESASAEAETATPDAEPAAPPLEDTEVPEADERIDEAPIVDAAPEASPAAETPPVPAVPVEAPASTVSEPPPGEGPADVASESSGDAAPVGEGPPSASATAAAEPAAQPSALARADASTEADAAPPALVVPDVAPAAVLPTEAPSPVPEPASPAPEPTPEPETPPPQSGIEAMVGVLFLPSLQQFLDATAAGHRGICVVRESPERLRAYVGARPVEVYWLTNLGRGQTLKPGDLEGLAAFFERALGEQQVTAFFLEGIEYLVQLHGIERVLARLVDFDRSAREHDARVWLHLNPHLIGPAELKQLVDLFGRTGSAPTPEP